MSDEHVYDEEYLEIPKCCEDCSLTLVEIKQILRCPNDQDLLEWARVVRTLADSHFTDTYHME